MTTMDGHSHIAQSARLRWRACTSWPAHAQRAPSRDANHPACGTCNKRRRASHHMSRHVADRSNQSNWLTTLAGGDDHGVRAVAWAPRALGQRHVGCIVRREPARNPGSHRRRLRLALLEGEVAEVGDLSGGFCLPPPACPGDVHELQEQYRWNDDRKSTGLAVAAQLASLERSALFGREPLEHERRIEDDFPQRASRSPRIAAASSSPG